MPALRVALLLALRRARNRPARWLLTALGIAAATAYGGAVLAEATVAGDGAARAVLRAAAPSERVVRITTSNVVTPSVEQAARSSLRRLGLPTQTEVVLLNPVRMGSAIVRPAAIKPLSRWATPELRAPCQEHTCPMLALGTSRLAKLRIPGLRIPVVNGAQLSSAAPLGFAPDAAIQSGQAPVLLTGDPTGLEHASALGGIYRTHSWFSVLPAGALHAWQLARFQSQLQQAQSDLQLTAGGLSLSAPFSALAAARAQADAAPSRLLLAGGGAIAVLALFLALAAGVLRQDQQAELERLRAAGAVSTTLLSFVVSEAALACAVGVLTGGALALGIAALLAAGAGLPTGAVLAHSLITFTGLAALALGWLGATALVTLLLTARHAGLADAAALAAVAALALALAGGGGGDSLTILLAPLACLAGGVLVARGGASLLRAGERVARSGPPLTRLAFVGLARSPLAPSLAIAFLAVSTAVGGFALAYRATLVRSAADQAADRVPLDALVAAGPDFTTPLQLAPLARWRSLSGGAAFPVRRTDASYVAGGGSVTVPALGVPAAALPRLHGWRSSDGPASLTQISQKLIPPGPARGPGPVLPASTRELDLRIRAPGLGLDLVADLRAPNGNVSQFPLAARGAGWLRALLRPGHWELEAVELREPAGLEVTAGHQNGENPAAATQSSTTVLLTGLTARDQRGHAVLAIPVGGWRAVGDASALRSRAAGAELRFATTGAPGLIRPLQPVDTRPIPVLVDPQTAAAADARGRLELTVDGAPVRARIAAVLRRFPTVPPGTAGFIVADEAELAAALDAWLPGQGRPDELWLSSTRPQALRTALLAAPFQRLTSTLRVDLERGLRSAGVARAVQGALLTAAALSALLALIGLLVSLLGSTDRRRVVDDLVAQGVGPRALRRELALRSLFTGVAGTVAGFAIALALTRLVVGAVRSAAQVADPVPPVVTITPWAQLVLWCLIMLGATLLAAALGILGAAREGRRR
ncbi:MAG TPA: FtsX-like permease family protein [Solirubrobacteraceae bacterium]